MTTQHEPDWRSLTDIHFLQNERMVENLNAALSAISLLNTPEVDPQTAAFWQERALQGVMNALSLHTAWSSLARYKNGEAFLSQHIRRFKASDLLAWLASELKLPGVPTLKRDLLLVGNQETLQEALWLLYNSAYALGPGVRMMGKARKNGMWFFVRYNTVRETPPTLNALMTKLVNQKGWRKQSTAFELQRATDFLIMNGCELFYKIEGGYCEFSFYVPTVKQESVVSTDTSPTKPSLTKAFSQGIRETDQVGVAKIDGTTEMVDNPPIPKAEPDQSLPLETGQGVNGSQKPDADKREDPMLPPTASELQPSRLRAAVERWRQSPLPSN